MNEQAGDEARGHTRERMEAVELEIRGRPDVERGVLCSVGRGRIIELYEGFQSGSETVVSCRLTHSECRCYDMQKRLPMLTSTALRPRPP
jgi:hypothetical protein